MKSTVFKVEVMNETLEVYSEDNVLKCTGYDIENEYLALQLRGGYDVGEGVFLVALREVYESGNYTLEEILKSWTLSPGLLTYNHLNWSGNYILPPWSLMPYAYLSFSPNSQMRRHFAQASAITQRGFKRMFKDNDPAVLSDLAMREDAPKELLSTLVNHPSNHVRRNLASNKSLHFNELKLMAKDAEPDVRKVIASHALCEKELWQEFLKDKKAREEWLPSWQWT